MWEVGEASGVREDFVLSLSMKILRFYLPQWLIAIKAVFVVPIDPTQGFQRRVAVMDCCQQQVKKRSWRMKGSRKELLAILFEQG